ncbi:MAG: glutathione S-transferase N-terminal domain-containing protein [Pseudomonadota bacterium]
MPYALAIGDRSYSSWSLRGWLLFDAFGIPVDVHLAHMRTPAFPALLSGFGAARTVPALRFEHGVVWDSLSILQTLAERHPEAGYWPEDPAQRALARNMVAEMHSGFAELRGNCPMVLHHRMEGFVASEGVRADLARLSQLWGLAREASAGPWLFGDYSAADAFFAPVAARIAAYDLPMPPEDQAYVATHLAQGSFRRWRALGQTDTHIQHQYDNDFKKLAWPGPIPLPAEAVSDGAAVNPACPFSGKPTETNALARIDGVIYGFCNPGCRDKVLQDAEAWPEVSAMIHETRQALSTN